MTVTEIANEVQAQLLTAVQTVQEGVVTTLEWVSEHAETILPESAARLTNRIPEATPYIDRGFHAVETFVRSQHDFATKIAGALQPSAESHSA
jgi:hypothetical protein